MVALGSCAVKPIQYAIDFIDAASRAETLEDLELCLKRALEPLGIMNFGAFAMMSNGAGPRRPTTLFRQTSEEWSAYYWEHNCFNHDAAIHEALVRPRPFTFQQIESRELSTKARDLFDVMREAMTIGDGYLLPVHDASHFSGLIGLYSVEQKLHPETMTALRMIGLYAMERARHLKSEDLQREPVEPCPLTPRQREMLSFAALGKSDWDISQIVGIAASTVNEHIEKAKQAIRVKTRAQAIAIAVHHGWITI